MAIFKHDSQGFLVGELITSQKDLLGEQQEGNALLGRINRDVRAIARALGVRAPGANPRAAEPGGRGGRAAPAVARAGGRAGTAQPRDSAGRFVAVAKAATPARARQERTVASERAQRAIVTTAATAAAKAAVTERDPRGRFQAGAGRGGSGGGEGPGDAGDAPGIGTRLAERLDTFSTALQGMTSGAEQVDPAVAAAAEVKEVVAPIGRGFSVLFRRTEEKKKERWYKRIIAAIVRKKDPAAPAPQPEAEGGFGVGALAGAAAARFLPALLAGAGSLLVAGLAALVGTKIGTAIYDWLDRSGIATKVFDAFDALKRWIAEKVDAGKRAVQEYQTARDNARAGLGTRGQEVFDASGRNVNDPRRLDLPTLRDEPTSVPSKVGRIIGNFHRGRDYMRGEGGRTAVENRALEVGRQYSAGAIGGLSDAQTRALVASTVATESRGGLTGIVNPAGYMGRYQAGAAWLADAGLIRGGGDAVKAAMRADGFTNEYKWGQAGGMTRFLKNPGNWNNGLTYEKFLADGATQDQAFKTNSDKAYAELKRRGVITDSTPEAEIAGLLKARHLAGLRGAEAVAAGGTGPSDANGTSARKYFEDVAKDRGGFRSAYSSGAAMAGIQRAPSVAVPSPVPDKLPPAEAAVMPQPAGVEKDKPVRAVLREPVGQDVGDRKIAHIVTGGIGG